MLRRGASVIAKAIKWLLILVVSIEAISFIAITVSNLVIYGHVWEGVRSAYDSHAIFRQEPTPNPTLNNSISQNKADNRLIWMLGGSTTRTGSAPAGETVASLMAKRLNQAGRPLHFTVLNFGQSSYNSLLEVQLLGKLLIRQRPLPSLIIMYDGANDTTYLSQYRTVDGHYGYRRMQGLIEGYRNSFLGIFKAFNAFWYASSTREIVQKIDQLILPLEPDSELVQNYVSLLERRYEYADRMARAHGARLVVFWQPTAWTEAKDRAPAARKAEGLLVDKPGVGIFRANMRTVYSAVIQRLGSKPYFIDLSKVLEPRTERAYKHDGVHLVTAGRRMVAREMADRLLPLLAQPSQSN